MLCKHRMRTRQHCAATVFEPYIQPRKQNRAHRKSLPPTCGAPTCFRWFRQRLRKRGRQVVDWRWVIPAAIADSSRGCLCSIWGCDAPEHADGRRYCRPGRRCNHCSKRRIARGTTKATGREDTPRLRITTADEHMNIRAVPVQKQRTYVPGSSIGAKGCPSSSSIPMLSWRYITSAAVRFPLRCSSKSSFKASRLGLAAN
jgi:hypothetical protein